MEKVEALEILNGINFGLMQIMRRDMMKCKAFCSDYNLITDNVSKLCKKISRSKTVTDDLIDSIRLVKEAACILIKKLIIAGKPQALEGYLPMDGYVYQMIDIIDKIKDSRLRRIGTCKHLFEEYLKLDGIKKFHGQIDRYNIFIVCDTDLILKEAEKYCTGRAAEQGISMEDFVTHYNKAYSYYNDVFAPYIDAHLTSILPVEQYCEDNRFVLDIDIEKGKTEKTKSNIVNLDDYRKQNS